jgi:hypothetical protein
MKKAVLLLVLVMSVALAGCETLANSVWGILVENKSDKEVYFLVGIDLVDGEYIPTMQLPNNKERGLRLVKPGVSIPVDFPSSHGSIRDYGATPFAVFVISPDVIENYTWDEIREGEMYLKTYERRCNYPEDVVYP